MDTVKTLTTLVKNPHVPEPFPDNSGSLTAAIDALQTIINSPTRNQSRPTDPAQYQSLIDTPATQRVKPRRSQRVQQQTVTQQQAGTQGVENPILQRLRRIKDKVKRQALGTSIIKRVNERLYQGWFIGIDSTHGYYKIGYDDGDTKNLTYKEVKKHQNRPPPNQFQQTRIAQANRVVATAQR